MDGYMVIPRWAVRACKSRNRWIIFVILIFGIVYACSLTFVYVEGDDATSIAFHALGRDASIQPPYGMYQGMMDIVLGVLPANEPLLRIVAVLLCSVGACCFVLLTLALVFDWLQDVPVERRGLVAVVLLLASPEFFYLGLVYIPNVIAMSFLLMAHLLLRRGRRNKSWPVPDTPGGWWTIGLSLLAFGFGAACRWGMAVYGGVIVADILLGQALPRASLPRACFRRRLAFGVTWGIGALLASTGAFRISGASTATIMQHLALGRDVAFDTSRFPVDLLNSVLYVQSLISPAFLVLVLTGLGVLLARRNLLVIIVMVGVTLILPWAPRGVPKIMLAGVPGMAACLAVGWLAVWNLGGTRKRRAWAVRLTLSGLLLGPWMIGIRVDDPNISWGPGFHMRRYDQAADREPELPGAGRVQTKRRIWPVVGAGLALPGSEGPRPVGGHAAVLLGGGWRALNLDLDHERRRAISWALEMGVPLLQDQGEGYAVSHLAEMGFTSTDPAAKLRRDLEIGPVERTFRSPRGDMLLVLRCQDRSSLTQGGEEFQRLVQISGATVVIYGYGGTMRSLYDLAPDALRVLGPASAVLDLHRLREEIARRPAS